MSTSGSSTSGHSRRHRLAASAVGLIAVTLVTGALAAPARADTSPVGIGVVRLDATEHGTFTVPVWSDTAAVTTVEATLTAPDTTPVDVPLTHADDSGLWSPVTPLTLSADGGVMPHLGHYAITVDATAGSDHLTRTDVGTLNFTQRLRFATELVGGLDLGPHAIREPSDGDRHATLTGLLVGVDPGTDTTHPLSGRTVRVTRPARAGSAAATQAPLTDSTGRFTTTAFDQDRELEYPIEATGDDEQVDDTLTTDAYVPVVQDVGSITAHTNAARVEEGRPLIIAGTAYRGQPGSAPAGQVSVRLSLSTGTDDPLTVQTDEHGAFRGTFVAVSYSNGPATWSADMLDPFVSGGASGTVTIPPPASYSHVSVTLAASGVVTAAGALNFTYGGYSSAGRTTYLDYSANGKTGWTALAHTTVYDPKVRLSATGRVAGYYRLRHPVSDELGSAVSAAVYRARTDTDVFAINASPEPVAKGHTVTVTGTLKEYRSGAWRAFAHRSIGLYFSARGAKTFSYVTGGTTDAHGNVRLRGTATKDGYWSLHYFGDTTHFDSGGTPDYVDVR